MDLGDNIYPRSPGKQFEKYTPIFSSLYLALHHNRWLYSSSLSVDRLGWHENNFPI